MADCNSAMTNLHLNDPMALITDFYPHIFPPLLSDQGEVAVEAKQKRRRKKKKAGAGLTGLKKRKLSEEQASLLEQSFRDEHKLESERKDRLASELGLDPRQVAVWFQNRRARWKSKNLEGEYSRLKSEHDTAVVEKCRLEAQVIELKQQLCDVENKLQRLSSERGDGVSSNSPSTSSFPTPAGAPSFYGEYFGMDDVSFYYVDDQYHYGHVEDQWI
ncbi:unnamed protein product [Cuscuta europaea]|uniref:Homeobox-leucine zipper protein n=1 Tax=Cuscuta europaea TaxID=41803 RepID=A0A9P0YLI6_CUSEU|nr:unnamed protein product [Cuscuta europaea]